MPPKRLTTRCRTCRKPRSRGFGIRVVSVSERLGSVKQVLARLVADLPVRVHPKRPIADAPQADADPAHPTVAIQRIPDGNLKLLATARARSHLRRRVVRVALAVEHEHRVSTRDASTFRVALFVVHAYRED